MRWYIFSQTYDIPILFSITACQDIQHSICKNCSYSSLQGIASCVCMKISITQFPISLSLLKKSLLHDSHILIFIYFFLNLNQQTNFTGRGSLFSVRISAEILDNIRNKTQSCVQNTVTDSCFVCISISTDNSLLKGFSRAHIIFYAAISFLSALHVTIQDVSHKLKSNPSPHLPLPASL